MTRLIAQQFSHAPAVLLTVDTPFFTKLYGTQIAVALFEVGAKIFDAESLCDTHAYLIDERGVFVRTYGEGGCKEVVFIAVIQHIFCSVFKAQVETKRTSCTAFKVVFVPFDEGYIFLLRLLRHYEFYTVEVRNHFFKCRFTLDKLFFRQNVGIVVIHGHVKVRGEIFKHATCARSATCVQKKAWFSRVRHLVYFVFYRSLQILFHKTSITLFLIDINDFRQ